ncbi:MAG: NAD-dependent epimerase/dehydratase family protein [Deinococcales bacterium]
MQVILSGARSLVGTLLINKLLKAGYRVFALSRQSEFIRGQTVQTGLSWHMWQDASFDPKLPEQIYQLIHVAPLWVLPTLLEDLKSYGLTRVLGISSSSRFTKLTSPLPQERDLAQKLITAEDESLDLCRQHNIPWTIFYPTMIYGLNQDKNISSLSRFIKRYGFFPLAAEGKGLRQPVHAKDVAEACLLSLESENSYYKSYFISGAEVLSYREMIERIFLSLNKKPRIINFPRSIMEFGLSLVKVLPNYRHINLAMLERIDQDLVFNHENAQKDFGFKPQAFSLNAEDLP